MIEFNEVPEALRKPGAFIEIDGSQAGLGGDLPAVLVVGQKLATGTAAAGELTLVASVGDAVAKAGAGSMLAQMVADYRAIDTNFDVYMLPLADNAAGVAATGTITVNAAATAAGTLALYIGEVPVSVGIATGQTPAQIALAIGMAINAASPAVPLTAVVGSGSNIVTLAALHKGTCGNDIDLRLNLYGETTPTGLSLSISAMAGGAGNPVVPALAQVIGTKWFRYVALGINDDATLAAWHAEAQRRYKATVQGGFRIFAAKRGDFATDVAFGQTKNYEHMVCLAAGINPTPTWQVAASLAAAAAPRLYNNPVTSLEGTPIPGMKWAYSFDDTQANSLLFKGMSTADVAKDGSVYISRLISMYQYRPDGSTDDAWLDINVAEVMERIRYEQRIGAVQRFRGKVAAKSDEGYKPGLPIVTEDSVRAYLLSIYQHYLMAELGWVQGYDYYKSTLVVQQHPTVPNRFNFADNPVINSPFYILAGHSSFRKAVPAY